MEKTSPKTHFQIPREVSRVTKTLHDAGYEAFLVGGCVRDLLLGRKPKDWDVTTNARPDAIQELFEHTFYENEYGTVGVVNDDTEDKTLEVIEVTPYRLESDYSDKRRPDSVRFSDNIEDDLQRRDFTINAIAYDDVGNALVDPYEGQNDLSEGIIRTVGDATERFSEDGLRLLRAVRLQAELGFTCNVETEKAIADNAHLLAHIANERIRDEFNRIVDSPHPADGLKTCRKLSLLSFIIPEFEETFHVEQGGIHAYDVWEHLLNSLQAGADKDFPFHVKLAALLHDIGKPRTRRGGKHKEYSFYGHEVVGAKMAKKIMERLAYPKETVSRVTTLIRWHMFFSDPDQITYSAIRRLMRNVGKDMIWDLMNLRICDRVGTGRPKEEPYRFRKYQAMIEEVMADPVSVGMLEIDGDRLQELLHMKPGPRIGYLLHALLEEVIENPENNTAEHLEQRAQELNELTDEELRERGESGKETREQEERKQKQKIRRKYGVK